MLDDFLIRALLAGVGLSFATGPLGAFVVWRRMAYFGDATAHAAILGVALALAFSMSVTVGTMVVALVVALSVSTLAGRGHSTDTTLGVLAHSALALGLVAISFVKGVRVDLSSFLFGDILTVGMADLGLIWIGSALVLALIIWRWSPLLTSTLNEELAASAGVNPHRERLVLTLCLAVVVALALKVVGALLIAAMLIVPAAAARGFSGTPERMAMMAILLGSIATIAGIWASYFWDTPAGPSIVVAAACLYVFSLLFGRRR
ncbi:MAG: iron chelate uptake ABC transporter family permease subunit [Marinosulfonomonas sp.]